MSSPQQQPQPRYSDQQLLSVLNACKSIEELSEVGKLYQDLAEAGDIHISQKILCFCRVKQAELIYGNRINGKDNN